MSEATLIAMGVSDVSAAAVKSDQEVKDLEMERRQETITCWQRFCATFHHCFENMTDCLNFWCCQNECYNFCCKYNDFDEDDDENEDAHTKNTNPVVDQAALNVVSSHIINQVNDRNSHSEDGQSESKLHDDNEGKKHGADYNLLNHEGNTEDKSRGDHHVGGNLGGNDCERGYSGGGYCGGGYSGGDDYGGDDSGGGDCGGGGVY